MEELPLRPIVSNLNTATYPVARYLAKILSPLSRSQYTVESCNKFVNVIKQQVIPSVPLDRIYGKHEITTNTGRKEIKDLITLCKKKCPVYF